MSEQMRRNTTGVGGIVVRDDQVLVVRMTYGPSRGRYMLPGGLVDAGETLDEAVAREVREETGVVARPVGIIGVRSRHDGPRTDTYVIWLLDHVEGEPRSDGRENDDVRYLSLEEIQSRDDVTYLVQYLAQRVLSGTVAPKRLVDDYEHRLPGTTVDSWKLFV